jgi:hypothetical protein
MSTMSVQQIIAAAVEQESKKEAPERRSIPWDNGFERLLVVNLPIGPVRLNPHSHRIKAQLFARPDRSLLLSDPYSDNTQEIVTQLLRAVENFEDLKADLGERGQREPGVVTREGVLVNANTRLVALRDLQHTHVRVMVLPPNATPAQISELELRLQVSRDYKQDYTFTNRLLFNQDCLEAGWDVTRVAKEVYGTDKSESKRVQDVYRDLRVLAMIDELIGLSDGKFGYPDFDDKETALEELDRDYEALKLADPEAALRLRKARMVAILSGVGYRDIRHIGPTFTASHLAEEIEEAGDLSFLVNESDEPEEEPEGLSLLGDDSAPDSQLDDSMLNWLVQTAGQKVVQVPSANGPQEKERAEVVGALQSAVVNAVAHAKQANKRIDRLEQPAGNVKDATKMLRAAEQSYAAVRNDSQYTSKHAELLLEKLEAARRQIDSLRSRVDSDSKG